MWSHAEWLTIVLFLPASSGGALSLAPFLPVSVTFHKGEDVSEILEFKQACMGKGMLEETDRGSAQLRKG